MASEDVKASESAVEKIVNLAEEAKLARQEIRPTSHAVISICKSLVAGGVAGGVSRTAVAPLERLKILLQVQNSHSIKYNGTISGLKYIWRTEGFKGLFKGNGTNCARIVPNSAVKFFSYEQASKGILYLYQQQTGNEDAQLTPLLRLGAGACAGIIAMSATYPMDMVRGRITVQTEKSPYQYRGMVHALSTILREEGPRALYKGWLPSVIGVIPYVGLNFAVYESLKEWLVKTKPLGLVDDSTELGVVTRLACGAVAETAETVANEVLNLCRSIDSPAIACIACPTLYAYLKKIDPNAPAQILEYDKRFEQYGSEFTFYDYNLPEDLPSSMKHSYPIIVADPPYLSQECLEKVAKTISFLTRPGQAYLLLLTGEVQSGRASELLGLRPCAFRPDHTSKLGNEFRLFTNYDPGTRLCGWEQV